MVKGVSIVPMMWKRDMDNLDIDKLVEMIYRRVGIPCQVFSPETLLKSMFDVPVSFDLEHIIDQKAAGEFDEEFVLEEICSKICRCAVSGTDYIDFTYKGVSRTMDETTFTPTVSFIFDIFYGKNQ